MTLPNGVIALRIFSRTLTKMLCCCTVSFMVQKKKRKKKRATLYTSFLLAKKNKGEKNEEFEKFKRNWGEIERIGARAGIKRV